MASSESSAAAIEGVGKGWYSEVSDLWPGQAFSLKVKRVLHQEKTKYQDLKVFETETYGTTLVLDDAIQCTERDEFAYQEMISFIPLCFHPDPKNVLIVGGGDGGVAREVQKFDKVKTINQVEIDDRVVEVSKQFLPKMACGFESPKLNLLIGDGFEFMKNHKGSFDVIITDSSDPVGPAESLFQQSYFELLKSALKPNGIVCSQGGTYWAELNRVKQTLEHCHKVFPTVRYASAHVPSYPCGQIGFVIGSLETGVDISVPRHVLTDDQIDGMNLRYYTPRTHRAAFDLPRYFEKEIAPIIA